MSWARTTSHLIRHSRTVLPTRRLPRTHPPLFPYPRSSLRLNSTTIQIPNRPAPTDKATPPASADPTSIETYLTNLPHYQSLRADPSYTESRPHHQIPAARRENHLVSGTLSGPGKLTVAPYVFTSSTESRVVTIFHIGGQVSGHPGFMQGGLMAVLFDEAFNRIASAELPSGVGMTVNMNLDFRRPGRLERGYVLEVWKGEAAGRKVWVEGVLKSIDATDGDGEGGVEETLVSEAKALFVEPRFAKVSVSTCCQRSGSRSCVADCFYLVHGACRCIRINRQINRHSFLPSKNRPT